MYQEKLISLLFKLHKLGIFLQEIKSHFLYVASKWFLSGVATVFHHCTSNNMWHRYSYMLEPFPTHLQLNIRSVTKLLKNDIRYKMYMQSSPFNPQRKLQIIHYYTSNTVIQLKVCQQYFMAYLFNYWTESAPSLKHCYNANTMEDDDRQSALNTVLDNVGHSIIYQ